MALVPDCILRDIGPTRVKRFLIFFLFEEGSRPAAKMFGAWKAFRAASLVLQSRAAQAWTVTRWGKLGRKLLGHCAGLFGHGDHWHSRQGRGLSGAREGFEPS